MHPETKLKEHFNTVYTKMATSDRPDSGNLHECYSCLTKSEEVTTARWDHDYCTTCSDSMIRRARCSQTFDTESGQDQVEGRLKKMDLRSETTVDTVAGASSSSSSPSSSCWIRLDLGDNFSETFIQTHHRADSDISVTCDACADSAQKALRSCLVCLSSYCDAHLRLHDELHARAAHTLVDATNRLQDITCSVHGKLLEVYCRDEKQRICFRCMLEDHKGHDVVAAEQQQEAELRKNKQVIAEQEKHLKELHLAKNTLRDRANATEEECEHLFAELILSISRGQTEIKVLTRAQERAELVRISELMEQVEEEISELKRCYDGTRQKNVHVLQHNAHPGVTNITSANVLKTTVNPQFSFGEVVKSMSALKNRMERVWKSEIKRISAAVMKDRIVAPTEPKTRKDFLKYLVPLTLDPDTAHRNLSIWEEKRVECGADPRPYLDLPERFDWWAQVLCREPLSTRCYWEAEWTGSHGVDVAVTYGDIPRKGEDDECSFGYNKQSWSLDCAMSRYTFAHDQEETDLSAPVSRRVGVYLDYKAGVLSFYSVSDSMELLHRAEARFTQPLHAAFGLFHGSAVRIWRPDR